MFFKERYKKMLKIFYHHIIKNEDLYRRVQMRKWSETIQIRRLNWIGHLMRLNLHTPASLAMQEIFIKRGKRTQGNRLTWIKLIESDIQKINTQLKLQDVNLQTLIEDRRRWQEEIRRTFSVESIQDWRLPHAQK